MFENTVNPDLRLSTEIGAMDADRKEQILGHIIFDYRDWLNDIEFDHMEEQSAVLLAISRFNQVASAIDLDAALIAMKLTVMHARVSRE